MQQRPKRLSSEEEARAFVHFVETATPEELHKEVRKALARSNDLLVSKAATVAAEQELADLAPLLISAFERFMTNPLKTDKLCDAKLAIVDALDRLNCPADDVFLRGVRHVQMVPAWGPPVDSAVELRVRSALALVRQHYPQTAFELTNLLADPEPGARAGAARALTELGSEESELLLRLRSLVGETDTAVQGEYFSALVRIAPERSVAFLSGFLVAREPAIAECAALALGESRLPAALSALGAAWDEVVDSHVKSIILLAISMIRTDDAIAFLLEVIGSEYERAAIYALEALKIHRDDDTIVKRIARAVRKRDEPSVSRTFVSLYETGEPE